MEQSPIKKYALITGASKGFGRLLALEFARQKINVVLISLPNENVQYVAKECEKLGVEADSYETDLTDHQELLKMTDWANKNFNINILINNAGSGGTQSFYKSDLSYIENLIQINVAAVSIITHQLLPNLLKQKKSYILNISSMAAIIPIGYKTVYSATKRYIQHFSLALHHELKGTGVSVSVVLPGPMKTNSEITERIVKLGSLGTIGLVCPKRAARVSISRLFRKKPFILVGRQNYINRFLLSLMPPNLCMKWMTRALHRELEL
jgi:short-subunit dehydrogenase